MSATRISRSSTFRYLPIGLCKKRCLERSLVSDAAANEVMKPIVWQTINHHLLMDIRVGKAHWLDLGLGAFLVA